MTRRRRLVDSPSSPDPAPVRAVRPHLAAWIIARHLAGGDITRLVPHGAYVVRVDGIVTRHVLGGVTVANNPERRAAMFRGQLDIT